MFFIYKNRKIYGNTLFLLLFSSTLHKKRY